MMVRRAPTKETRGRPEEAVLNPIMMAAIAPTAAPLETPRMYGSARGFLRRACKIAPDTERPAPTKPANKALGNRRERMIARSVSVPSPFEPRMDWRRMAIERMGETFTLPTVMERRRIRIKRKERRVVTMMTLLSVTIFIKSHCKLVNGQ
jgi:hypothetical protein